MKAWLTDLEWHVFAAIFLLAAASMFQEDGYVRVVVFYSKWSSRGKAWVDLGGTVLFLIPWCVLIIYSSFGYALQSYTIGERSPEPGGLPARFLIKGAITLGFILLLIQGISVALTSFRKITRSERT